MKLTQSAYDFDRPIPGRSHREPFRIFGFALARALGDFLIQNVVLASMKCAFEHSNLFVYSRLDRPYKKLILDSNIHITKSINFRDDSSVFPAELFDINSGRPVKIQDDEFYKRGANHPDFVAAPSMLHVSTLLGLSNIASLRFPEDRTLKSSETLERMGLDPSHWFCTLHYREPTYEDRPPSPLRDNDPAQFLALRDFVIDELGGQVVRLGHPEMTDFPARDGFVDLAKLDDSFELQTFAVTRSRFVLAGPSGIAQLGSAYNVPTAYLHGINEAGCWNHEDINLFQRLYDPAGHRMNIRDSLATGILREQTIQKLVREQGFQAKPNTTEELCAATREIYDRTANCEGWRKPAPHHFDGYPNQLGLPITREVNPAAGRGTFVEYPD